MTPSQEIKAQWQNPGDIFSLLLLVGGDSVQKAIARLVGVPYKLPFTKAKIHVTPIAFSFGWVAYAFMSLSSVIGESKLMPEPDTNIQVINCDNGFVRSNSSWALGRLLRDQQSRAIAVNREENPPTDSTGKISLMIDLFDTIEGRSDKGPTPSAIWYISWLVLLAQQGIAIAAWIKFGYWSTVLITASGTFLAMLTAGLPQWSSEKWSGGKIKGSKEKITALTRGNGYLYVMIIKSKVGDWDLEAMSSAWVKDIPGTRYTLLLLTALWLILLITVTGMKENSWFLLGVGTLGMLHNIITAAFRSTPAELDMHLKPMERGRITGYQWEWHKKQELSNDVWTHCTDDEARREYETKLGEEDIRDALGALTELEKCVPKAGQALVPVFFPGGLKFKRDKVFWAYAEEQGKIKK